MQEMLIVNRQQNLDDIVIELSQIQLTGRDGEVNVQIRVVGARGLEATINILIRVPTFV
jgi:hypothetical protein